ncbi:hypothetical protein [Massilia yuzhufengensis]|uniref:Uncharacterized protein n=1 Tax=Massilia yuzhufengensis TaxID=1164594 RepID=A0A1I1VJG1_9BURK|nr:hypothetical protein [Massilia yuzhufengensis]SFD82999.1 hypothetical protein SAMN05216204_1402 [Massilia yuzhufengensis]
MFIERLQHPVIEYDLTADKPPTLVHYFSDRAEPLKTALPLLVAGGDEEHVLVVASPLAEIVDGAIWLHRSDEFADMVVVDQRQRAMFAAVRAALLEAVAKIEGIQYANLDDEE